MSKKLLDDLQAKLGQLMSASPAKDIERNIRAVLTQAISRLDVATAEEYDVQKLLISRLENKILSLEARLSELEHKLRHMEERTSHPDGGK